MSVRPRTERFAKRPLSTGRLRLHVAGTVQGVGFRPFVYRLAHRLGLGGWVRNTSEGAEIEAEGRAEAIEALMCALRDEAPPLCAVRRIDRQALPATSERDFTIRDSAGTGPPVASIPPDVVACAACLREIRAPADRRYRYPFTNCTDCGPRFSLIRDLPYDRPATTMAGFPMCPACRAEYEDPASRRFHTQPNTCPACGPKLTLWDTRGQMLAERDDALMHAVEAIRGGKIVAVKGIGGFHLMADARCSDAVATLRRRKQRPAKPFAVMTGSIEQAEACCELSETERTVLESPRAPIVLLKRRRPHSGPVAIAEPVAPDNPYLGVMLPYTPLHRLLLDELAFPVIATSGNLSDEPICTDEREALGRLGFIADLMLIHDRPIARPVDDSIVQVIAGRPRVLRRGRGYAPQAIALPASVPEPTLAVGPQMKCTVGLAVGDRSVLSQHIGDLETVAAAEAHRRTIDDLQRMLRVQPTRIARDAHPDYRSTHLAEELAGQRGLPSVTVQHHAAHVYAGMAEHAISPTTPVLGVSWDGTGFGSDGTVWGGELLRVEGGTVERIGHLRPFRLPGGETAIRQPYRTALAILYPILGDSAFEREDLPPIAACPASQRAPLKTMLERCVNAPLTTSAGRLFDAAASLLGLCHRTSFEGEAAMRLQFAAEAADSAGRMDVTPYPIEVREGAAMILDWTPSVSAMLGDRERNTSLAVSALRFHLALVNGLTRMIRRLGDRAPDDVLLTGGCFQNKLLAELAVERLSAAGFRPRLQENVPPNDGGIALGQLYAAALPFPNRTHPPDVHACGGS